MAKILVVDDDKGATDLIEAILLASGHTPITVGFQLCRMFRQTVDFRVTPIVIITALDNTDSRVVAIGAGANGFLRKPFHVADMTEKIRDLLP
jgi:DNA-binding response OmpR family regulator